MTARERAIDTLGEYALPALVEHFTAAIRAAERQALERAAVEVERHRVPNPPPGNGITAVHNDACVGAAARIRKLITADSEGLRANPSDLTPKG